MSNVLNNLKARRDQEEGFTLIELMVVVLIIAILIAIAIPTFLGARTRAQDRAAQSSLRNALTAAKTAYTDSSDYAPPPAPATTATQLKAIEPSLDYEAAGTASGTSTAVPSFKDVSVAVSDVTTGDSQVWSAAVLSKSGTCFYIKDIATGGGAGTFYGSGPGDATCDGTTALAATAGSW